MISVFAFLFIFAIVVLVHELGHLGAAKGCGVKVFAFGIGFGQKLWSRTWGGTQYSINAFPLGGYVRIAGLDDQDDPSSQYAPHESYLAKPAWQKMFIIAAGPLMNIILAVLIITLFFTLVGVPGKVTNVIEKIVPGMPAMQAGLLPGDKLLEVDQVVVTDMEKTIAQINVSHGQPLRLLLDRNGKRLGVSLAAMLDPRSKRYIIGINLASGPNIRYNPFVSFKLSIQESYNIIKLIVVGLIAFFSGKVPVDQVAGPIGIAQMSGQVAHEGFLALFRFLAFLSLNLGVLNLVPFPALDGGRLFFLFLELLMGKDIITVKRENYVHYAGFIVLIIFILFVTYQDILRIFK